MGAVTREMEKKKTSIRREGVNIPRDQAIVECFNCTLTEHRFGHKYAVEMRLPDNLGSTKWVKRLPTIVSTLKNEVTRLIGRKPTEAIKNKAPPDLLHLILGLLE